MKDTRVSFKYIFVVISAVLFTWILHEFSHWMTYTILGYSHMMTLNKVAYIGGEIPTELHQIIAGAAGPLITIIQAFAVCLYLKFKGWNKNLYPFLFIPFYMRLLAGILNVVNPNDEGTISLYFGLGLYTISIIVSGLLFYWVLIISKKYDLNKQFLFATTLIVMMASSFLILYDQFVGVRIL